MEVQVLTAEVRLAQAPHLHQIVRPLLVAEAVFLLRQVMFPANLTGIPERTITGLVLIWPAQIHNPKHLTAGRMFTAFRFQHILIVLLYLVTRIL